MAKIGVTHQHHVLHILCRPAEPCFVPKGRMKLVFDVLNTDYLAPQFQDAREELEKKYYSKDNVVVPLKEIKYPILSGPMELGRDENFSIFIPYHQVMLGELLKIFMSASSYEDFFLSAVYARDRVNPFMFVHAYCTALLHRRDTRGLRMPPLHEIFPDNFLYGNVLSEARAKVKALSWLNANGKSRNRHEKRLIFPMDFKSNDLDPEHRVAYFREDIGINMHHWHWHLVYPSRGPRDVVNKDRRGELFYYMHRQIIARYDNERLCNRLPRVTRLMDLRKPISEAYFPKLHSLIAGRTWSPRNPGATLSDVRREDFHLEFDIEDMEHWKSRIIDTIQHQQVTEKGGSQPLTGASGIDILGNMVESSSLLSPDYSYYGDLNNYGHAAISLCHDPDGRYKESFGVMGDNTTAMRDPMFYRWHAYIDYIFEMQKDKLPPYKPSELVYEGISIESVSVYTQHEKCPNTMITFWEEKDIALTNGLDFTDYMPVHVRITRLQHRPFHYKIKVKNNTGKECTGTVRIFLAPKFDERGQPMLLIDQKRLFIELDKFQVTLSPAPNQQSTIEQSRAAIERDSKDSYVTKDEETSFEKIEESLMKGESKHIAKGDLCGCGWPRNMLIPKGSANGFHCQLFVMITNAENDLVEEGVGKACSEASSYCGVRDKKYPDKRPMGFPFDRSTADKMDKIEDFVKLSPNMAIQDVKIIFKGPGKAA